mgnify:CR=1 FL=1
MARSLFSTLLESAAAAVDRRVGWDKLPRPLAILTLVGLRDRLRHENLYDTGRGQRAQPPLTDHEDYLWARTRDGMFNDLNDPQMGTIGSRFGRNVPLRYTYREPPEALLEPNPRLVSRRLLTRDEFQPAETLNVLAAAWIQFEVHDWFSHGKSPPEEPWEIQLEPGDDWPHHPMTIQRTRPDPSPDASGPATFVTDDSHWWDASQIYGSDPAFAQALRSGENGKLRLDEHGLPPAEIEAHVDLSGAAGNFWMGLALLHSLFMREHNAICDHLHAKHPELDDEALYQKARLVNAALLAKIGRLDVVATVGCPDEAAAYVRDGVVDVDVDLPGAVREARRASDAPLDRARRFEKALSRPGPRDLHDRVPEVALIAETDRFGAIEGRNFFERRESGELGQGFLEVGAPVSEVRAETEVSERGASGRVSTPRPSARPGRSRRSRFLRRRPRRRRVLPLRPARALHRTRRCFLPEEAP